MRPIAEELVLEVLEDVLLIPKDSRNYMAIKFMLSNLPTMNIKPQWIPCSERLPEAGKIVLVYGKKGGIYTAIYSKPRANWDNGWWKLNSKSHLCNPEAWMPLPEPYEETK